MSPRLQHKMILVVVIALLVSIAPAGVTAAAPLSCAGVTEIPLAECQALEALYTSTNGAGWTNRKDWLATTAPCSSGQWGRSERKIFIVSRTAAKATTRPCPDSAATSSTRAWFRSMRRRSKPAPARPAAGRRGQSARLPSRFAIASRRSTALSVSRGPRRRPSSTPRRMGAAPGQQERQSPFQFRYEPGAAGDRRGEVRRSVVEGCSVGGVLGAALGVVFRDFLNLLCGVREGRSLSHLPRPDIDWVAGVDRCGVHCRADPSVAGRVIERWGIMRRAPRSV